MAAASEETGASPGSNNRLTTVSRRVNARFAAALFSVCAVLLFPFALIEMPPLLDFPNHLARMVVLAAAGTDPVLNRFYQIHWSVIPNLALDLSLPTLMRVVPAMTAGRLAAAVILLLPVAGSVVYHRSLTGRWSAWPLTSALFAYNAAFLKGFLNFNASIGLALLFAAGWQAWRERHPARTIVLMVVGTLTLFFCHLAGLVFLAILIGAREVTVGQVRLFPWIRRARWLSVVFAVPVLLYFVSNLGQASGPMAFRSVDDKAVAAMAPVINVVWFLDIATAALLMTGFAVGLSRRWWIVPWHAVLAIVLLAAGFIVAPNAWRGTFDLDMRFIIMAAVLLSAAMIPTGSTRAIRASGAIIAVLIIVRTSTLAVTWHNWSSDLSAFQSVIRSITPGDAVVTVTPLRDHEHRLADGRAVDTHWPALILIERHAWWPYLFDNNSQQPVETREPWRALAERLDRAPSPLLPLDSTVPEVRLLTHLLIQGPAPGLPHIIETRTVIMEQVDSNGSGTLFKLRWRSAPPPSVH